MWDLIFAPIPDAFLTAFQDAPLDLLRPPHFYRRRRGAVEEALASLAVESVPGLVQRVADGWERHYGRRCHGVDWAAWTAASLQLAAAVRIVTITA